MPRIAGNLQISLFGAGRQSGSRTGALRQMDDERRFDHAAEAQAFGHQVKTAAGGGDQRTGSSVPSAKPHVNRADFVLSLLNDHAVIVRLFGKMDATLRWQGTSGRTR